MGGEGGWGGYWGQVKKVGWEWETDLAELLRRRGRAKARFFWGRGKGLVVLETKCGGGRTILSAGILEMRGGVFLL